MPHIPLMFCGACGEEMLIDKNGVQLQVHAKKLGPYYKIASDRYICPGCGAEMLYVGRQTHPYTEHLKPDFKTSLHDEEVYLHA